MSLAARNKHSAQISYYFFVILLSLNPPDVNLNLMQTGTCTEICTSGVREDTAQNAKLRIYAFSAFLLLGYVWNFK